MPREKKKPPPGTPKSMTALRSEAEERLRKSSAQVAAMSPKDVQALVYELQVHQVELEMQNEELRRAQLELAEARDRYLDLYEYVPVGYLTLDPGLVIREANLTATKMLGLERAALVGIRLADLVHPSDRDACRAHLADTLASSQDRTFELTFRRLDNSIFVGRLDAVPVEGEEGDATGCRLTITDVTDRVRFEEQLRRAKQSAEAANVAKSRFLANMSHELRTPMNSIMGMTDLALAEDPAPPVVREYLQAARQSADALLELLDQVLDISRIEAGKLELESAPFSLHKLVEQTVKTLGVRAYQKDLELVCDLAGDLPDAVVGDSLRLRQVLVNLIGNAIKFTERGEVIVRVGVEARGDAETRRGEKVEAQPSLPLRVSASPRDPASVLLQFSVQDTGIGISAADQRAIFDSFTQADASTTRKFGGSGLGLTISKSLVELMGGTLAVKSGPGAGSTFSFTVRLGLQPGEAERAGTAETAPESLRGVSALVVVPHAPTRSVLQRMLARWSMKVELAGDAAAASVRLSRARAAKSALPLVIADARLPKADGFSVLDAIRDVSGPFGAVVLLVSPDDRRAAARCGETRAVCLEKPIGRGSLLAALKKALGADSAAGAPPADPSGISPLSAGQRSLRVLVAEDSPANQMLCRYVLQRRGHEVVEASTGEKAYQLVQDEDFDVVLMDVSMPGMDGIEATAAIRRLADAQKARLPIVALTAHAMRGDQERCLAAGMNAYLSKPFQASELIQAVEHTAAGSKQEG
jgi:PAS domain S-box-containing protein